MKFIYSLLFLFTFTFAGIAQDGVYVKYETEVIADGEGAEMMSMMFNGTTMEVAANDNRTWSKTIMGSIMTMTMELKAETKEMTIVMTGMAGNMAFQGNSEEVEDYEEDESNLKVELSNEKKKILGYNCKKATVIRENGSVATYWYTEKIKRPEGLSQMPEQIPGMSLMFEVEMQEGVKVIYKAVEATKNTAIDGYKVEIPEGVEVMPLAEMAKMGSGGN